MPKSSKTKFNILKFSKYLIAIFLSVVPLAYYFLFNFGLIHKPVPPKNISIEEDSFVQNNDSEKTVLGTSASNSFSYIHISGGDYAYSMGGVISYSSVDKINLRIGAYKTAKNGKIALYKTDIAEVLKYLQYKTNDNGSTEQTNKQPELNDESYSYLGSLDFDVPLGEYDSGEANVDLPINEAGIFYIDISLGDQSSKAYVIVSNFGVYSTQNKDSFVFWGQSFLSGKSINEGNLDIYSLKDKKDKISEKKFSSQGLIETELDSKADIALAYYKDQVALIPLNLVYLNSYDYDRFTKFKPSLKYFGFTDKPIYKPGDKINFKVFTRQDNDSQYTINTAPLIVEIRDSWEGDPLYSQTKVPDEFGGVSGEFILPEKTSTNKSHYLIVRDPTNEKNYETLVYFDVEHYRKPEYTISIKADKSTYTVGEDMAFSIQGSYFSGQPLSNSKVNYSISSADTYTYTYLSNFLSTEQHWYPNYGVGNSIKTGELELDNNGVGILSFKAVKNKDPLRNQIYNIEVSYTDQSGNPVKDAVNAYVYNGEFSILQQNYSYSSLVGKPVDLDIILKNNTTDLVNLDNINLTYEVKRIWWEKIYSKDSKYPNYEKREDKILESVGTTNEEGEVTLSFTPQKSGSYEILISGTDKKGNILQNKFYAWATDKEYVGSSDLDSTLNIKAEKDFYAPGDTIKFLVNSDTSRDVLFSVERANTHKYKVVSLNTGINTITEKALDSYVPNIYFKVGTFSLNQYIISSDSLDISSESKKLNVSLLPSSTKYGPGENVELKINTKDLTGANKSSEVTVWVVDKALFELSTSRMGNIFDTFWYQRYNNTTYSHSLEGIVVNTAERGGGCFAGDTDVLMQNGKTKNIQDIKVGDFVSTLSSDENGDMVTAKVLKTFKHTVSGYLIINGSLKVTPEHILNLNDTWQEAADTEIGDHLVGINGQQITVGSVEYIKGSFEVYNLEIENEHTYIAGGVWVHNDKGNLRSEFKDVAYWNPSVITDSNGNANINFKVPDNLTTWSILAVAASKDTAVGQNVTDITVSKDLVVRPILPNILRVGDSIILSSLIQNFSENTLEIEAKLESENLDIKSNLSKQISLATKEISQLFWKLVPKEAGDTKIKFSALSSNLSDEVEVSIPTITPGYWNKYAFNSSDSSSFKYTPSKNYDPKISKLEINLAPSLATSLLSQMDYLIYYPYGCVEQTTSRLVPAIIAAENPNIFPNLKQAKNLDEIINKGISRLMELQKYDGGWRWWGDGESDTYVSSYVYEYLIRSKNLGYEMDEYKLSLAKSYLLTKANNINTDSTIDRIFATYALSTDPSSKLTVKPLDADLFKNLPADVAATGVLLNTNLGVLDPGKSGLNELLSKKSELGDGIYWDYRDKDRFNSNYIPTATALKALVNSSTQSKEIKGVSESVVRYITAGLKDNGYYWSNTHATAKVIDALISYSKNSGEVNPSFDYEVTINGISISNGKVTAIGQSISTIEVDSNLLNNKDNTVEIIKNGEGKLYSTVLFKEFVNDQNDKGASNGITISRKYINTKGPDYNIAVGDLVNVMIEVNTSGSPYRYSVIEDKLPSGMIPVNTKLKNEANNNDYNLGDIEYLPDGVIKYQNILDREVFSYTARVINAGEFTTPGAYAEVMYSPEVNARSASEKVKIDLESKKSLTSITKNFTKEYQKYIFLSIAVLFIFLLAIFFRTKYSQKTKSFLKLKGKKTNTELNEDSEV